MGGGGRPGRRRRPPPMILEFLVNDLGFTCIFSSPPSPFPPYNRTYPDTLPNKGREFLSSPRSPSLPPVRPGPGHPDSPPTPHGLQSGSLDPLPPLPDPRQLLHWDPAAPEYLGKLQCVEVTVGANHGTSIEVMVILPYNYIHIHFGAF